MVILHVTGMPSPTKYGSVEKWFVAVCRQAQLHGDTVYVAYQNSTGDIQLYHQEIATYGAKLIILGNNAEILDFCRTKKTDAIHFHFGFCGHNPIYPVLHRMGCQLFVHFHGENGYYLRQDWKQDPLQRIRMTGHRLKTRYTARFFKKFLGCSHAVTLQHQRFYRLPKKKTQAFYLGIPRIPDLAQTKTPKYSVPTIVCTAFHSPIKGVDVLLDALALLKKQSVPFRLLQIGGGSSELNGEDTALLHDQCLRLGLSQDVEWIGLTNRVNDYLALGDIYCQPSRTEAMPLSIAEAMQFGLPIVASCVGGVPEMVHDGENGYLVEPDNVAMLAEKLKVLLSSPQLRSDMGHRSVCILEEIGFFQDESAKRVMDLYTRPPSLTIS